MCGLFGAFNIRKAAEFLVIGLHGLQHRAIDYAGIVSTDGTNLYRHAGEGLARQVFSSAKVLDRLHGRHALGHIRYPTAERQVDEELRDNTQPLMGSWGGTPFALAHNGNLTNVSSLDTMLGGRTMATSMDTERIVRLIERLYSGDLEADLTRVFSLLRGSYTLILLFPRIMIAVVDPSGCRPLSLGRKEESYFLASESCAFSGVAAEHINDIEAGHMRWIEEEGTRSIPFAKPALKQCRFEANYFAHPASKVFGEPVSEYRKNLGRALEYHCPAHGADIVAPVPDSSRFIAMGYAHSGRSGAYDEVLIRSHYVGRTFIAASQAKREEAVAQKFHFAPHAIAGKSIVLVDDSIVRGTTLRPIVEELRRYGAHEVHVRIATPPIKHPCRYGIDTPTRKELIAAQYSREQIKLKIKADSLMFLPLDVQKEITSHEEHFCFACMDGQYWDEPAPR